jgi:Oxidoreductase FAD-binding domain.
MESTLEGALQQAYGECLMAKIIKKELITHDSYIYTFELPAPNLTLGIRAGNHIALQ